MKAALKHAVLALIGGCIYYAIEIAWRGHSHWTMAVLGGICFVLVGGINEYFPWSMPLALQGAIGAAIITALEFVAGVVLNVWLGLGIWDYSAMPFNVLGQIHPGVGAAGSCSRGGGRLAPALPVRRR